MIRSGQQRGLIEIGYWKPRQGDLAGLVQQLITPRPDPRRFVDPKWDAKERDIVIAYLDAGKRGESWLGDSICRFCGKLDNGSCDLTDDVFVWPEGYSHYLREHQVRAPREFVAHVLRKRRR